MTEHIKSYVCARWHELNACSNNLNRPIEEIERELMAEIQARVLDEHFIATMLKEARRRLAERVKQAGSDEGPQLQTEAAKLKGEIANLAEAVAGGGTSIPALVEAMKDRQARLTAIEARVATQLMAPRALQLEVKRMESDLLAGLRDLQKVFTEQPVDWRKFLENFLDGKLTLTPVTTWRGNRYRIDGKATLGGLVSLPAGNPYSWRPQRDSNPR